MPSEEPIVEAQQVEKFYGQPGQARIQVVAPTDLAIYPGEILALLGPSGSGKSTLLRILSGLAQPSSGRVLRHGQPIAGPCPDVSLVFQSFALFPWLTVLDNVLIAIAAHSGRVTDFWTPMYGREQLNKANEVLAQFGLRDQAAGAVSNLPEGGRKVLDVALSVILEPKVLLMDEPTSGVSARDKFSVMDTLMPTLKERNVTTIFVEHDMEIIERYAERAVAFDGGKIIADGPVAEVLATREVRRAVLGED